MTGGILVLHRNYLFFNRLEDFTKYSFVHTTLSSFDEILEDITSYKPQLIISDSLIFSDVMLSKIRSISNCPILLVYDNEVLIKEINIDDIDYFTLDAPFSTIKNKIDSFLSNSTISQNKNHNIWSESQFSTKESILEIKKELWESEEKFRMVFESDTDALFIIEADNLKIQEINEAAMILFGLKKEDFREINFVELWKDKEFIHENIKNKQLRIYSEECIRSNGDAFPADATFSYSRLNNISILVATIRDVSERYETEKEIIKAKEKAEESDRLKSSFLANMSHEIRTPLNAIVGFSRLLIRKQYSEEKQKVMMAEIQSNSDQLLNIINDILDISKIESNQLDMIFSDISSNEIIRELYDVFELQIQNQNKKIDLLIETINSETDQYVYADGSRVKQIFSNLLNNAVKFTNEGHIKFGYKINKENLPVFFVEDTGKGIAKKNLSIIFEYFRQEEESYARRYGGSGLGLSISKSLVELMGGKIWVESDTGKGATFFFTLPVKKVVQEKQKYISIENTEKNQNLFNKKILLVDDLENSYYIISEILYDYNVTIRYVKNGRMALDVLEQDESFDLILMDIHMPELNGVETARRIKELFPDIPIIAQTAYALKGDEENLLKLGMDGYISKPIDMDELIEKINQFIG